MLQCTFEKAYLSVNSSIPSMTSARENKKRAPPETTLDTLIPACKKVLSLECEFPSKLIKSEIASSKQDVRHKKTVLDTDLPRFGNCGIANHMILMYTTNKTLHSIRGKFIYPQKCTNFGTEAKQIETRPRDGPPNPQPPSQQSNNLLCAQIRSREKSALASQAIQFQTCHLLTREKTLAAALLIRV